MTDNNVEIFEKEILPKLVEHHVLNASHHVLNASNQMESFIRRGVSGSMTGPKPQSRSSSPSSVRNDGNSFNLHDDNNIENMIKSLKKEIDDLLGSNDEGKKDTVDKLIRKLQNLITEKIQQ